MGILGDIIIRILGKIIMGIWGDTIIRILGDIIMGILRISLVFSFEQTVFKTAGEAF